MKKERKNEKRDKKGTRINPMTERKRRQNPAKCCSVSLQSWMSQWKLLKSEQSSTSFGKNLLIIGSKKWYMFDFSWTIVVIIVQSGLKLYNFFFTILAAGVEMEQVCNLFAQRGAIMCVFDRTEDRTNQWAWRGNFYAAQKQDYCCEEH